MRKKGKSGSFFGESPNNEPHPLPHASEASAWLSNYEIVKKAFYTEGVNCDAKVGISIILENIRYFFS
ncbi:MAG: hypothetical protein U5L45_24785 [Saprospiraceae bacterium]|nr:hypothetical protein [Saprospiraceae bacterium]